MEKMEASLTVLIMSIGSSAAIALGIEPDPQTGKQHVDKELARFNIDLLSVLKSKTQNNLSQDESRLIDNLIHDLQLKFVSLR